jgi:ferrous iron transport protein B
MADITIALAGNPNAGKSTIFNTLTGLRQHVGNWPGKTVEKKEGVCQYDGHTLYIVDLPGAYSLTAYSPEEIIARDFIIEARPDVVIDVIDATNLERNLYLAVQILEMGVPVVLALNMIDALRKDGVKIDLALLSQLLGGVPVMPTAAVRGEGLDRLLDAAIAAANHTGRRVQLDTANTSRLACHR